MFCPFCGAELPNCWQSYGICPACRNNVAHLEEVTAASSSNVQVVYFTCVYFLDRLLTVSVSAQ